MLKHRFLRAGSKGLVEYNEKYFGTKSSFNSYIDGFEKSIAIENQENQDVEEDHFQNEFPSVKNLPPPPRFRRQLVIHKPRREATTENAETVEIEIEVEKPQRDNKEKHKANLEKFEKILRNQNQLLQADRFKIEGISEVSDQSLNKNSHPHPSAGVTANHKIRKNAHNSNMQVASRSRIGSRNVLETLQSLREGNNLEKFLQAHGLSTSGVATHQLKQAFDRFLAKNSDFKEKEISKYERQLESLRELTDNQKLQIWLESKGVPSDSASVQKIKNELQKYFEPVEKSQRLGFGTGAIAEPFWGKLKNRKSNKDKDLSDDDGDDESDSTPKLRRKSVSTGNISSGISSSETFDKSSGKIDENCVCDPARKKRDFGVCQPIEEFNGRSLVYRENTLAKKLWDDFMAMSAPKQVAVVVGITVVTAALGFASWQILLMAFPSMFSANQYWGEVLAQWFIQRQESTYHLLEHTAQNAKPLSTTWANQYLLWKYI